MGPASAMMRAFGWTTVLGPGTTISRAVTLQILLLIDSKFHPHITRRHETWSLPMVTSPLISLSTQTTAPAAIFTLKQSTAQEEMTENVS